MESDVTTIVCAAACSLAQCTLVQICLPSVHAVHLRMGCLASLSVAPLQTTEIMQISS